MNKVFSIKTQLSAALAAVLLTACGQKPATPPPGPPVAQVSVEEVKYVPATWFDEYPGTVVALNQIELRPQVSGFISGVHFSDGARVKKGQTLYTIDDQLYEANYQQAVANLEVQKANLAKARRDSARYHELAASDAIARQLVDNADAALEVSKKQVQAAKANILAMKTNVNYTVVKAPFDGVIGISRVKTGAAVSAGQTILNTVSSEGEMAVDFNIDQKEIFRFSTLLQEKPATQDSTFRLAFGKDAYPNPGRLALLDRAVNPQTGTLKARLIFPNPKNLLVDGMTGTVKVRRNNAQKSILIPYKAVTEQLGEYFVYVPNDSNTVSQRKVIPGKQIGRDVVIDEGLSEGEKVVVEGVQNLREGSKINSAPPAAQTNPAK
ncbi:MAG: efflux RND transporter periplasmic adaptor subunit [Bacteroidia bacterium]|nr:efflux RND transporter periplasmic adaptor subunit [Bacteroidia bacterium]